MELRTWDELVSVMESGYMEHMDIPVSKASKSLGVSSYVCQKTVKACTNTNILNAHFT